MTRYISHREFLAVVRLMSNAGLSTSRIAKEVNRSATTIRTMRNALALPPEAQAAYADGRLTVRAVATLSRARRAGNLQAAWEQLSK
jgi:ParB-like chromosome segregation protein Spo0J